MNISHKDKTGLNTALNEAEILGVEFDKDKKRIGVTFNLLTLDQDGNIPSERRAMFIFKDVARFVASYRKSRWDDLEAPVIKFEPEDIFKEIQIFGHLPIYGWEFINASDGKYDKWKNRLSFDYGSLAGDEEFNTIDLFQEGENSYIVFRIWFKDFEIVTPDYKAITTQDFIENGKRAWDSIYNGKPVNGGVRDEF